MAIKNQFSSNLFLIVCEKNSREHEYFRQFVSKYNNIRLKFYPNFNKTDFNVVSDFDFYKKKLEHVINKTGINAEDEVWVLLNTENQFNQDTLAEVIDLIEDELNFNYTISNPCFEIWLYYLNGNLNEASIACSDLVMQNKEAFLESNLANIQKTIEYNKKIDTENRADGNSIPCPMATTVDKLIQKLIDKSVIS